MGDVRTNSQEKQTSSFEKNLSKYIEFASWLLFYPDLFLDLIKPKEGGINLHSDQRIFLRCATRFFSIYGCFPRG
jgi:ribonucleoside-diphosphate reductase alpha chain